MKSKIMLFVDTGATSCLFPSSGNSIISGMKMGDRLISSDARLVAVLDDSKTQGGKDEAFESNVEKVSILQNTALS